MPSNVRRLAAGGLAMFMALAGSAAHAGPGASLRALKSVAQDAFMPAGARTVAPFAHVRFCVASPGECSAGRGESSVEMTPSKMALLRGVNNRVNASIRPSMPEGLETWIVNPESGNCHDYAVTKRHELIRAGWPSASLRLAVAYTRAGEGHLVLVVRTSDGDLVLDNLTQKIATWNKSGLRFVMVASGDKPRDWYALR